MYHPLIYSYPTGLLTNIPKDSLTLDEYKNIMQPCIDKGIISKEQSDLAITIDEVYSTGNSYIDKNHKDHPIIHINRDPRQ